MKKISIIVMAAAWSLLPLTASAQANIQKAFDALVQHPQADVTAEHSLSRDPETGVKSSQLDIYDFAISKSLKPLLKDIQNAFERDREQAYTITTAQNRRNQASEDALAVGDGTSYRVGSIKGSSYIYACFLDPADAERIHRYAYAMEWKEDGDQIVGRLAITYATTQQYRTRGRTTTQSRVTVRNGNTGLEGGTDNWLASFNMYARMFRNNPNSSASSFYANFIYQLCKQPEANKLTTDEKKLVVEELAKLMRLTEDDFLKAMFKKAQEMIHL